MPKRLQSYCLTGIVSALALCWQTMEALSMAAVSPPMSPQKGPVLRSLRRKYAKQTT